MHKEKNKQNQSDKEISYEKSCGKKFEDLTPEEMQKIQGSGDVGPENITTFFDMTLSKGKYKC